MADKSTIELALEKDEMELALDDAQTSFEDFGDHVNGVTATIRDYWDRAMAEITSTAADLFHRGMDLISEYVSAAFDDISRRVNKGIDDFVKSQAEILRMKQTLKLLGDMAGFTADQIQAIAQQLSEMTVHSADAFRSAAMILAKFTNVRGDIFKDALKGAADLAAVTGDLNGAVEKFGEALQDPVRGLKMLADAGYEFSKAEKAMIDRMLQANDIIGLQRFILEAAGKTMGGFATDQAKTLAGQMDVLNNVLDNLFEEIGSVLVPTFTQYLIPAMQSVGKVVHWLVQQFQEGGDRIGEYIQAGIEVAIEWFWKLVDVGTVAFSYVEAAIDEFGSFFEGTWHTIKSVAMTVLADLIEVMVDWSGKAKEAFLVVWEYAKQVWEKMLEGGKIVFEGIAEGWNSLAGFLKNVLANMWDNFTSFWEGVKALLSGDTWEMAFKNMERGFSSGIDKMKDKLQDLAPDAAGFDLDEFVDSLREGAGDAADDADDAFKDFDDRFAKNLKKNQDRVQAFVDTLKGIMNGEDVDASKVDKAFKSHKGESEDEDKGHEGGHGFEGLEELNKRIQSAALASPETKAVKELTNLSRDWKAQDASIGDDMIRGLTEIKDAFMKRKPDVGVFGV